MNHAFRLSAVAILAFALGCSSRTEELRMREVVLRESLYTMRQAIDQFTQDKNKAPQNLQDLVHAGYFHAIPKDPITNSSATWRLDETKGGVTDVHSGSNQVSTEGTRYSDW